MAAGFIRQELAGKGCLACAVRPGNDDYFFVFTHTSSYHFAACSIEISRVFSSGQQTAYMWWLPYGRQTVSISPQHRSTPKNKPHNAYASEMLLTVLDTLEHSVHCEDFKPKLQR